MNILGIGGYSHDSAAALLCDGRLVAAVAEERLSRVKHQGGVPHLAVQYCLDAAGITLDEVDHIGCYMRPFLRMGRRIPYRLRHVPLHPVYSCGYMAYETVHNALYAYGMRRLRGKKTRLHFMEHHPAHAASAFLVSPFEEAALLCTDYVGEFAATWTGRGSGTRIRRIRARNYPHSLGVFYSGMTDYLGFLRASDEYKVMGLASYGEPAFVDDFRRIIRARPDGWYDIDLSWMQCHIAPGSRCGYFSEKFLRRFGPPRKKGEPVEKRHMDLAASAQQLIEEAMLNVAKRLHRDTRLNRLCMAGGVALNCSMNGRMLRESPFDEIFIQPAAGDDGIAIGAAYQLYHQLTGRGRDFTMRDTRLGPEFSDGQIRRFLDSAKIPYHAHDDIEEQAARLIADGNIVGWFQGRVEFGPRALGARSILADPTRPDMKDLLNKYVKHREDFRPFAPSCLAERAGEYFEGCTDSPFMLFVHKVTPSKRPLVPAITHVDGTARVQTVSREVNPRFYRLIEYFERLRGVPMVLNTSFNVMGEPIVCTPAEAIRCFYSTGIDALVIGNCVVVKR